MTQADLRGIVRHGLSSIDKFAEHLVGHPLWPHQLEMALSPARYRVCCAGRQVGKSRLLAIEALHTAYSRPGSLTLVVSAGEVAAGRLLEECARLAINSPLLSGAVLDDHKTQLSLSNGSRIVSVPASQKQIRGWSVDLLILDEAGFIDPEIWRAAEPAIIARRGSRVILSSSPWGKLDHFFRQLWNRGMTAADEHVASFHWPSSISPMISQDDLDRIQAREAPHYFDREYMAEWTDEAGAWFTTTEIDDSVADYVLTPPENVQPGQVVVGGIDYGMARDANAVVYIAALADADANRERPVFYLAWLEQHWRMEYATFVDRLVDIASKYSVHRYISETNGVGQMPTQVLRKLVGQSTYVAAITTDSGRKTNGFGRVKMLLQEGRLVLPRHPDLLRQLHALTYEQTPGGDFKISVPENVGHDDLAMALLQACSAINPWHTSWPGDLEGRGDTLTTGRGTRIHTYPRALDDVEALWGNPKKI